jgi:hypothetical protein
MGDTEYLVFDPAIPSDTTLIGMVSITMGVPEGKN